MVFANYACCASCSTFFKDFHLDLAHTIKGLLGVSDGCQAILFSPRRGNTLDQFVKACQSAKLNVGITEQYDAHIWSIHKGFLTNDGNSAWPNYDEEHSYPLLLSITHTDSWASTKGKKEPVPPMWNFSFNWGVLSDWEATLLQGLDVWLNPEAQNLGSNGKTIYKRSVSFSLKSKFRQDLMNLLIFNLIWHISVWVWTLCVEITGLSSLFMH